MNGNRAAIRHRAAAYGQGPPILKLVDDIAGIRKECFLQTVFDIFLRVRGAAARGDPQIQDVRERHSRSHLGRIKIVHRAVEIVREHQSLVGAEHADPMRHVRKGCIQQHVRMLETPLRGVAKPLTIDAKCGCGADQQGEDPRDDVTRCPLGLNSGKNLGRR